jgi:hypothetical protein
LAERIVDQIKPVLGACTPVWGVGRLCAYARRRGKGDFEASRLELQINGYVIEIWHAL